MNLENDSSNWEEYRIDDLFWIETGKDLIYRDLEEGEYPVIGHGKTDLGLTAKTSFLEGYKLYDNNSTITLADRGNFYASAHPTKFYIGTRVKALTYKYKSDIRILQFICTIINQEEYRFCYGRNSTDKLPELTIKLPTKNKEPDEEYMIKYIDSIDVKNPDSKPCINKNLSLKKMKWCSFNLLDLFETKRGQRLIKEKRINGNIPYYSASDDNNGLTDYISNPLFTDRDKLIYTTFGDSYYIEGIFTASDEITILNIKDRELNIYIGLFLATILKRLKWKYSFGRKAFYNKIHYEKIKLPVDNTGKPDWKFMEDYIKSLPYSKALEN